MPRPNPTRRMESESNLAKRIARLRASSGLSYEGLARLMADVGCPINASALYKIEKGNPPRKVTVDELVAFSLVFRRDIEDLLTPIELLDQKRAQELIQSFYALNRKQAEYLDGSLKALVEFYELQLEDSEIVEYIGNHLDGTSTPFDVDDRFEIAGVDLGDVTESAQDLWRILSQRAAALVTKEANDRSRSNG